MTEDGDKLRKFLASDDPAMVKMGISLVNDSNEASGEVLGMILGFYTFHKQKDIRSLAKLSFIKSAPPNAMEVVKKYWQAEYRTQSWIWGGWMQKMILELEELKIKTVFLLTSALKEKNKSAKIITKMVGNYVYGSMSSEMDTGDDYGAILFSKTKPKRKLSIHEVDAIGIAMINVINFFIGEYKHRSGRQWGWGYHKDDENRIMVVTAIEILGDLGVVQAVDMLIEILSDRVNVQESTKALRIIGDERAVEPIIRVMENAIEHRKQHNYYGGFSRTHAARWRDIREYAKALGKMGNFKSIKPLMSGFEIESKYSAISLVDSEKTSVIEAISQILERAKIDSKNRKNIIKFLTSEDESMRTMGESLLTGITGKENVEEETKIFSIVTVGKEEIKIYEDEDGTYYYVDPKSEDEVPCDKEGNPL